MSRKSQSQNIATNDAKKKTNGAKKKTNDAKK